MSHYSKQYENATINGVCAPAVLSTESTAQLGNINFLKYKINKIKNQLRVLHEEVISLEGFIKEKL